MRTWCFATSGKSDILQMERNATPAHDFQIISPTTYFRNENSCLFQTTEAARQRSFKTLWWIWTFLDCFGALETSQAKVPLKNRCVQNTSKSITTFRGRAWNPTFSEILEFSEMQNFSSTRLESDILWKQSRSEISAWASWGTGPKSRSDIGPSMSGFAQIQKLCCPPAWFVLNKHEFSFRK